MLTVLWPGTLSHSRTQTCGGNAIYALRPLPHLFPKPTTLAAGLHTIWAMQNAANKLMKLLNYYYLKKIQLWLVSLSGWSATLQTEKLLVQFLVRTHAWVAGQVPSWGRVRGNHTLMFLSLSFSFPSPLSKNK